MVIQPLSTRLIKPNFCFDLSHRRSTTVSLETRNLFFITRLKSSLEVLLQQNTRSRQQLQLRLKLIRGTLTRTITCTVLVLFSNGNRTEWSPIRSVIIRVITKSDDSAAGVRFVYHEYDYRPNWTTGSPITN